MKIKELFESTGNLPKLYLSIEALDTEFVKTELEQYKDIIKKRLDRYGFTDIRVQAVNEFWEVEATIPSSNVLKQSEFAYRSAIEIAERLDPVQVNHAQYQVAVDWPPAFPLLFSEQCPELFVTFHQKASIKGIDKLIAEVDFISLRNSENIVGFLNLLKIKNLNNVEFSGRGIPSELDNIINKHLKDRNIIACQEELFKNNLDEYAKL